MYPSDLTDAEWKRIAHHFRPKDRCGSGCKHEKKHMVDAILYVVKGGIQWRMRPKDFPPWKTVDDHFSKWNKRGVWEAALDTLNRLHRKKKPRQPHRATGSLTRKAPKPSMPARSAG